MDFSVVADFFIKHYQWLFSGAGVFVLSIWLSRKAGSSNKVKQEKIIAKGDVVGRDKR